MNNLKNIFAIGINHKTASVELREKFYLSKKRIESIYKNFIPHEHIDEICIISTCNRTEFYLKTHLNIAKIENIFPFIEKSLGVPKKIFKKYLYCYSGIDAVRHIYSVASGIDSMILGEGQILGQVKEALQLSLEYKTTHLYLNKIFNMAVKTGKRARAETNISRGITSVGQAAVELIKRKTKNISKCKIIAVGTGKVGEIVLKSLIKLGARFVFLANRTYKKAKDAAKKYNVQVIKFDNFKKHLKEADIAIFSTGAPHLILTKKIMSDCIKERNGKTLLLMDLAVPRNVSPDTAKLKNVFLYNIDSLQCIINDGLDMRKNEIARVKKIIEEELVEFNNFLERRKKIVFCIP